MDFKIFLFITIATVVQVHSNSYPALDESLYENVLDAEKCHDQIRYIRTNSGLQIRFADAGIRTPRGVAQGNFADMGNYHQCLGITHENDDMSIQGKYCTIQVPLNQEWKFPWTTNVDGQYSYSPFDPSFLKMDDDMVAKVMELKLRKARMLAAVGVLDGDLLRSIPSFPTMGTTFNLAVCIPEPCSTQQAITSFLFNVSAVGFRYEDGFCRLPDDKPWSPADTVAIVMFSAIGALTLISTTYDLFNIFILKKESKQLSRLYTSFSVYTNGRRLMNFSAPAGTLHCLDGIRTWAMLWVVVGHSFSTEGIIANPFDTYFTWFPSIEALWITAAPITVDTFFCIAGVLLVYTSAGKMNGVQLLKSLPIFYLNRLLRLFPLLAAAVLLQASFFHRMSDGPYWSTVEDQTNFCRTNWWITLLHVQNFVQPWTMCIPHSWYIAIDVQLYLVSPLVLFWVVSGGRAAWPALVGGLLAVLTAATVYNFVNDFPALTVDMRPDIMDYFQYYYFNTLTRASPFFVGMVFGYILHLYRGKEIILSWATVTILWACSACISTTIFFYPYFVVQPEWDQQFVNNLVNSFMRPAWAVALCWMVVACTHGYGGPVNWFLTLDVWKLPARVSYAIFIFHYPLMFVINGSAIAPIYFSAASFTFKSLAHITLSLVVAYFATLHRPAMVFLFEMPVLLIDAPFSTLSKMLLDRNKKPVRRHVDNKPDSKDIESDKVNNSQTNENKNE